MSVEDYIGQYPVAIIQDRYQGCYSGGPWIAIAECEHPACDDRCTRIAYVSDQAGGSDWQAASFWGDNQDADWLAVGPTPDAALAALRAKYVPTAPGTP